MLLGVDRFMSECRAITNLIGNGVATVVVAKWEKALDEGRLRSHLAAETPEEAEEPEMVADTEAAFALQLPKPAQLEDGQKRGRELADSPGLPKVAQESQE